MRLAHSKHHSVTLTQLTVMVNRGAAQPFLHEVGELVSTAGVLPGSSCHTQGPNILDALDVS